MKNLLMQPLMRLLLVLTILTAAGLACNFPGGASNLPPTAQPMSTEEVQNLENQIQATLQSPDASGEVTITLSQDQVNSIIAGQMAQQSEQVITDPSVKLTGGHLEVYGKVNQNGISANLQVVMQPQVDASGNPHLNIVSMNLGGMPVPDVLKNRIAASADDAISSYLFSNQNNMKVKSIDITEGQMTITGTPQQP
jgi:hypothetical protein